MLDGGHKSTTIGLAMGLTIGIDADKRDNNTHLLVIMRVKLSQKIGLLDLNNWTWLNKENVWEQPRESV